MIIANVIAIVCFCFAALAGASEDGEVVLEAVVWLGIGLAAFAAGHLPLRLP